MLEHPTRTSAERRADLIFRPGLAYGAQVGGERARFSVGQIIDHLRFDYRGVVFDVDPTFQGTDEWYQTVARSRPPRDEPWYHVLPDGASHTTYVAERNLAPAESPAPIDHPLVAALLGEFREGRYLPRQGLN